MRVRFIAGPIVIVGALLLWQLPTRTQAPAFDAVIRNGRIADGTGNPWFVADVGIKGDTIAAVEPGLNTTGARVIDAAGLVVRRVSSTCIRTQRKDAKGRT